MSRAPVQWAIVGGGMLGLTLALRLRQAGAAVTVFDAADRLGGLASAWSLSGVVWDRHYHVVLKSDARLLALLGELGLADEMEWTETRTGFYTDGAFHSLSNTLEFLRFPPLGLLDKVRLGATILRAAGVRDGRELENIPIDRWLRRWSGARTFERLWLPLLRTKLGDDHRIASAAFIQATIARMYAARRSGMKRELFGHVRGGYARILERFAEVLRAAGVEVVLGEAVHSVVPAEGGRVTVRLAGGRAVVADRAIVTAAAPIAARLCPALAPAEVEALTTVRYQGIVCASLLLRRPLTEFYVTNITEGWVPFTAVIGMSNVVAPRHLGGHHLVYLPKYVAPDDPIFARTDEEIESEFLTALARMYPAFRRDDVACFRVSRVRHVFPVPTLGYSTRLPPMATSVPGLYLVNSAHIVNGTLNVDETVGLAERALGEVAALPRTALFPRR